MRKSCWCLALFLPLWTVAPGSVARGQEVVSGEVVGRPPQSGTVVGSANSGQPGAVETINAGVVGGAAAARGGVETVNAGVVGGYVPWHSGYHHIAWGQPVALVVPPTATHQTNWGWGVGNTRVTPIYPQFAGPTTVVPSQYQYGRTLPTPYYVSDTLQFGVYYIRGPW